MPKGQGFKKTGGGPKYGSFSFPSGAGFTHSGTSRQNVKGYTRATPKRKFATGGMVTAPMASGDSSVIKRAKPVTGFDAEHGGKGPLRPGFNKGGKACYAEGGKVNTMGAAIKMVKQLISQGNSPQDAANKAARRYGVSPSQVKPPSGATGGGGLPAEKQMLARGGMAGMVNRAASAAAAGYQQGQAGAPPPKGGTLGRTVGRAARGFVPAPQGQKVPGRTSNHMVSGYGSFGRRPIVR